MSLPTQIPYVKEGEFLSAENYNKLVDVCNALVRGVGRNGVRFIAADAGLVWEGNWSGSAEEGTPAPTPSGNINFKGRWLVGTRYNKDDIVTLIQDSDYGIQGTYISLVNNNLGNYPPTGLATANAHWTTLAKNRWGKFVVGDINFPEVQYPQQTGYCFIDKNDIYLRGQTGFGFMEDGITPVTSAAVINPDTGIGFSGQYNTFNFSTTTGYDDYPLTIEPIKLAVCVGNVTKYLWVMGYLSDT